jgi:hypothetical protein
VKTLFIGLSLNSPEWKEWYKHAEDNMLFDVCECVEADMISPEHLKAFYNFIKTL